jgi:hypothetical protein
MGARLKRPAFALSVALAIAIILSYAFASVFVYYPITVYLSPVNPPIRFLAGSNANQSDLGGGGSPYVSNTIGVIIGPNSTSLTLYLHPTIQHNYYRNVSLIVNTDGKAYYITIRVNSAANLPAGSQARLLIYNAPSGGSLVASVNLLATVETSAIISASGDPGSVWRIDLHIYIPEGSSVSATSASLQLIYSPSNETPPTLPP